MTDQEAKKIIVDLAFNEQRIEDGREVEALRKGVIAINEAQAYREIGTVKEFKTLKEKSVPKESKVDEDLGCGMGDLISRSALLKKFDDTGIQITFDLPVEEILGEDVDIDNFTMLVQDAIQVYKKMVIGTIKDIPTSYSVDAVVAELEEEREYSHADFEEYAYSYELDLEEGYDDVFFKGLERAIDIVKRGGVE